jgi:NADH-quinone oxidoreductase subunit M
MFPFLPFLVLCPLVGAGVVALLPRKATTSIQAVALSVALVNFVVAVALWMVFDTTTAKFQFVSTLSWLPLGNMTVSLGVDGISLLFLVLTTFLVPV